MSDREENSTLEEASTPEDTSTPSLHDDLDSALANLESQPEPEAVEPISLEADAIDADEQAHVDTEKASADAAAEPVDPEKAAESSTKAETPPEDDVEALIKESGIKSARGQERIRATFTKLKETEAKATEYEQDINQFKDMVKQTRMSPDQFGEVLEIGRLANSPNVEEKKLALERLDAHRAMLAKELGVDVPGVDVLDDFPELKAKVEGLEITREDAIKLARYERQERVQQQAQQSRVQMEQETRQYQDDMKSAGETATAIFNSFAHETDYPAKMKMIEQFVKQPGKLQEIAATYTPKQLPQYFRDLYANIRVAQAPAPNRQPISSRPMHTGAPSTQGQNLRDSLAAAADNLGI
jgi:hypothetical protein